MSNEYAGHIIESHYQKLEAYSNKIAEDFDTKSIHRFRVEYKKLRAFLRMVTEEDVQPKMPKKLKKFYHIAGDIRDLQLYNLLVKNSFKELKTKPKEYRHLLDREIKKLEKKLLRNVKKSPPEDLVSHEVHLRPKFTQRDFLDFLAINQTRIEQVIAFRRYSDEDIHNIRKCLKDIFYNKKAYDQEDSESSPVTIFNGKTEEYLHGLLEELGNFQDKRNAILLMQKKGAADINLIERELLLNLGQKWLKEKKNMRTHLIEKLETELSPNNAGRATLLLNK